MDPTLRVARRAFAAAALLSAAALATACGNSPSTAASNNAAPAPSDSPTAATTPAPTPTPSATTPTASPGPSPCPTQSLQVKMGVSQGTAGSVYTTIVFTNTSNATCTLYGYPGVSLTTGKPVTQIGKSAKENPATPRRLVTLKPQASANRDVRAR